MKKKTLLGFLSICLLLSAINLYAQSSSSTTDNTLNKKQTKESINPTEKEKQSEKEFSKLLAEELARPQSKPTKNKEPVSWGWQITRTTLVLIILLGGFWLVYKLFLFKKKLPRNNSELIKEIYQYQLEAGKQLKIIEVNKKLLLIAISDAGVQLLTEYADPVHIDQIRITAATEQSKESPDFLLELTKALKKQVGNFVNPPHDNDKTKADDAEPWNAIGEVTRQKLREIKKQRNEINNLEDKTYE